jgi:hypothetical protein
MGQEMLFMKLGAADCFLVVVALLHTSHEVIMTICCSIIPLLFAPFITPALNLSAYFEGIQWM